MTKKEEIEDLEEFIKALQEWQRSFFTEDRDKLRSHINKKKGNVQRIVQKAGCAKIMTLQPPPGTVGMIMRDIDPFSMIFQKPYNIYDMTKEIIDMIEETIGVLSNLGEDETETCNIQSTSFWNDIHTKVRDVAEKRYKSGHYADAVESALKEVNNTVKKIVKKKTGVEYDGVALMNKAFSPDAPIISLDDLSTETGKNIQRGYMQIFAGAMTGIRNPKAHENIVIDDLRARHQIYLASLLLYVLDDRI
ncbi:TIGR02391 family protein [Candidatus Latescibacterota bacterium]